MTLRGRESQIRWTVDQTQADDDDDGDDALPSRFAMQPAHGPFCRPHCVMVGCALDVDPHLPTRSLAL